MNTFRLQERKVLGTKPEYYVDLFIDENDFLEILDKGMSVIYFQALQNSANKEGKHLIFTCSCGVADCGGWDYVQVTHKDNKIIWQFEYGKDYYFEFEKENYIKEIKRLAYQSSTFEPSLIVKPMY